VSPRLDLGSASPLPYFTVTAGQTLNLSLTVAPLGSAGVGDQFAFVIEGTPKSGTIESLVSGTSGTVKGIKNSTADRLTFTLSSGWTTQTSGGTYFTNGPLAWIASKTLNVTMTIGSLTPPDVYTMTFRSTGFDSNGVGRWSGTQEFLINVIPEPTTISLVAFGGVGLVFCGNRMRRRAMRK
jgi:hypothetical protein